MSWFTAKYLFRSVRQKRASTTRQLCEYRSLLVKAEDEQSARKRALRIVRGKQHTYLNSKQERVRWVLETIDDVKQILGKRLF